MLLLSAASHADSPSRLASVAGKLEAAGFSATSVAGGGFLLSFNGHDGASLPVTIAVVQDAVIFVALVAKRDQFDLAHEGASKLLTTNWSLYFLKLVVDARGDLVLRYDILERMVDADGIKWLVSTMVEVTVLLRQTLPQIKR